MKEDVTMAERLRSTDGRSETEELLGDIPEKPDQQGRSGGQLQRRVGTRDEMRRVNKGQDAGVTRVTGSDERATGEDVRDD